MITLLVYPLLTTIIIWVIVVKVKAIRKYGHRLLNRRKALVEELKIENNKLVSRIQELKADNVELMIQIHDLTKSGS